MQRRQFIRSSCTLCVGIGAGISAITLLQGCVAVPVYKTKPQSKNLVIPETQFLENKLVLVRTPQLDFDILLVKDEADKFHALYMQCSHQNQPLTATNDGLFCASHGSRFDLDGKVQKAPASKELQRFPTYYEKPNIFIQLS
ncbi:MAG: Rieske 2Fe-2S domain-containing protein [Bacteroidetes bacterium]|nr:Rieske 2Fe-2S domain-containing protein [Bacteroidota bacterium]